MVGEVREYDELAGIYEKLDTVRIPTSLRPVPLLLVLRPVIISLHHAPRLALRNKNDPITLGAGRNYKSVV